jgi:hypothetical protein
MGWSLQDSQWQSVRNNSHDGCSLALDIEHTFSCSNRSDTGPPLTLQATLCKNILPGLICAGSCRLQIIQVPRVREVYHMQLTECNGTLTAENQGEYLDQLLPTVMKAVQAAKT